MWGFSSKLVLPQHLCLNSGHVTLTHNKQWAERKKTDISVFSYRLHKLRIFVFLYTLLHLKEENFIFITKNLLCLCDQYLLSYSSLIFGTFHNELHWQIKGNICVMFIFLYLTKKLNTLFLFWVSTKNRHLTGSNDVQRLYVRLKVTKNLGLFCNDKGKKWARRTSVIVDPRGLPDTLN